MNDKQFDRLTQLKRENERLHYFINYYKDENIENIPSVVFEACKEKHERNNSEIKTITDNVMNEWETK